MSYIRSKEIKGNTYYYLVEGNRGKDGKVHQKVLKYLGTEKPEGFKGELGTTTQNAEPFLIDGRDVAVDDIIHAKNSNVNYRVHQKLHDSIVIIRVDKKGHDTQGNMPDILYPNNFDKWGRVEITRTEQEYKQYMRGYNDSTKDKDPGYKNKYYNKGYNEASGDKDPLPKELFLKGINWS